MINEKRNKINKLNEVEAHSFIMHYIAFEPRCFFLLTTAICHATLLIPICFEAIHWNDDMKNMSSQNSSNERNGNIASFFYHLCCCWCFCRVENEDKNYFPLHKYNQYTRRVVYVAWSMQYFDTAKDVCLFEMNSICDSDCACGFFSARGNWINIHFFKKMSSSRRCIKENRSLINI